MSDTMKVTFLGANQTVTGSCTLLQYHHTAVLVDCGLFQGPKEERIFNWDFKLPLKDINELDAVVLTHAHLDHSGLLPRLIKQGWRGPIYASEGTIELCKILLLDSAHLQTEDAEFANRTDYSHHKPALPLYDAADVEEVIKLFKPVDDLQWVNLGQEFDFRFFHAGHIIGAMSAQFSFFSHSENLWKRMVFSGDLGTDRSLTLRAPATPLEAEFLVMESTYGDRLIPTEPPLTELAAICNRVFDRGGVLLIPAFAVGRTQDVIYVLSVLKEKKLIPDVPVYVDSPMALKATDLYMRFFEEHKWRMKGDLFTPPIDPKQFFRVELSQKSMALTQMPNAPMVIISASGMLTGGRIMHHLKSRLPHAENGVLFLSFQAKGTKGRLLKEGIQTLYIHHEPVAVKAEIFSLEYFSAHADQGELIAWAEQMLPKPQRIFLNHGEMAPQLELKAKLLARGFECVEIPGRGQSIEL
jgi:metallo-beta-lactamase family protein